MLGERAFLFGGLANDSEDPKNNIPRYIKFCWYIFHDSVYYFDQYN